MKKLAVIILNWNGLKLLQQFLPLAAEYTIDENTDLIVADNGSTDGSAEWVESVLPDVKVIRFAENHGFSEGYNRAIAATRYEYTVLLNSDVEVTPGWAQRLLSFMEATRDCGACQPKIKSWREREKFEYAGAAGGYLDRLGFPYCRGRLVDIVETDRGQYDEPQVVDVAWASGACLMVRTEIYEQVGGLDKDFFAHMEEIDLCCRIHAAGWRVCAISTAEVFHVGGASLKQGNPQKTYLNFRNNLLLLHKNLPKGKGRRMTFVRRLVDTLALLQFMVKGDMANAKSVWRAHRDFRKMRQLYTSHPEHDVLRKLPGSNRYMLIDRYLHRH